MRVRELWPRHRAALVCLCNLAGVSLANSIQNLAPPPPAPHGPRLPSPNQPRSRTPSPQRSIGDIPARPSYVSGVKNPRSEAGEDSDGYEMVTPIGLSEKALGKRRVVDEEDDRMCPNLLRTLS